MLSAEGLRHTYGRVVALDGVSFTLAPGQTLAIFGPNGAGKTTLLKVLAGLIRPQQGRASVAGGRRAVGWIGHQSHLYGHLSVLVLATHNVDEGVELATDVAFQRQGRFVQLAARGERGADEIAAAYRRAVTDA